MLFYVSGLLFGPSCTAAAEKSICSAISRRLADSAMWSGVRIMMVMRTTKKQEEPRQQYRAFSPQK